MFIGKAVVHEWGHYRWGLFDEYWSPGQSGTNQFYVDGNGNIAPTRCGLAISGFLQVHLHLSWDYDVYKNKLEQKRSSGTLIARQLYALWP